MMNPRIAPLEPPYAPEVEASLAKWMPPGSGLPPLALFRTLALHPLLRERMRPLGAGLLGHGTLPARIRELMILRTSARCGARYEWGVHVTVYARMAELDDAQVEATATAAPGAFGQEAAGRRSAERGAERDEYGFDRADRLALNAADELHDRATLSDDVFATARARFGDAGVLEMAAIAGFYHLIAFVIGTARVAPEPWAAAFPEVAP